MDGSQNYIYSKGPILSQTIIDQSVLKCMENLIDQHGLMTLGVRMICYAEDLAIIITSKFEDTLTALMQTALKCVEDW